MKRAELRRPKPNAFKSSIRPRRLRVAISTIVVTGLATMGSGLASATNPDILRTEAGCYYATATELAGHIQTCNVWSEAMQSFAAVKVRPSDRQSGETEQAIYALGGVNDPSGTIGSSVYGDEYNLVFITGSTNAWSADWQSPPEDTQGNYLTDLDGGTYNPQWMTFIGEELPLYLAQNFDISTSANAIAGLSISGGQSVNIALKYPEVFSVALSTSGYYQTDNLLGYFIIPYILWSRSGIANAFNAMWGTPLLPGNTWGANDVSQAIYSAKANNQTIIVSTGNGLVSSYEELAELLALGGGFSEVLVGSALEFVSFLSTIILNVQAKIFDLPIEFVYTSGTHTWARWARTAEEEASKVQDALSSYAPVASPPATIAAAETATATATSSPPALADPAVEAAPTVDSDVAINTGTGSDVDDAAPEAVPITADSDSDTTPRSNEPATPTPEQPLESTEQGQQVDTESTDSPDSDQESTSTSVGAEDNSTASEEPGD